MQKQSFRFERLMINRTCGLFHNLKYFPQVMRLYIKYLRHLEDDFSPFSERILDGMVEFIEKTTPHFYLVLSKDEVCGFFVLENIVGKAGNLHSAEVVTCFEQKYWGTFTKYAARIFQDFCFDQLRLVKLKALIYPQNSRVKALLRVCGFRKEAQLYSETKKCGKMQDIEIYTVLNNKEDLCN